MEFLNSLNVAIDCPVSETLEALSSLSLDTSLILREKLFFQSLSLNLACDGDVLVSRRDSRLKSLGIKLAEDVVTLIGCIKNSHAVPRGLLKHGKRSKDYLVKQRDFESSLSNTDMSCESLSHDLTKSVSNPSLISSSQQQVFHSATSVSESIRYTSIMKEVNLLKNSVKIVLMILRNP